MLKAGIVGLPNVGKSTLFNALTRTRKAEAANYPFCTIDPNVGIVTVPDARLEVLQRYRQDDRHHPGGGGVCGHRRPGQRRGGGRRAGQQISDPHPRSGRHRPSRALFRGRGHPSRRGQHRSRPRHRDHQRPNWCSPIWKPCKNAARNVAKDAKRGDKEALAQETVLKKIEPHLNAGKPALTLELTPEEKAISRLFWLMTDKPTIFACNVKESDLATADKNPFVQKVREYTKTSFRLRSRRHQRADRKRS